MKKYLLMFVALLLLTACGEVKIHENVDEQVAKDSMQVMDRILDNIDKDLPIEDVSEDDHKLFERFTNKYIEKTDVIPIELDGVDESIYLMASGGLIKYAKGASLESDKEDIKENYEYMIKFIETGKAAGE
ncbi:hypothetical protein [Pseudogracilibacillus auburnensis]|uniref:hypothetical protein n=1 Tax=Pseudogracilibacillus auburnensis TaxID=1494959 RepID=UPI001A957040|nr:hypothetical protein [Pseudogracilibacillus auburnensis]MBO1003752.1 hypothetical protein [Pseudogracilibacillus auburnensis]